MMASRHCYPCFRPSSPASTRELTSYASSPVDSSSISPTLMMCYSRQLWREELWR
ncbi:hypothetical protein DPMN_181914 [Dreissena polymorpha]|uniref:Uncharacterized protein n=1 Tax=Dreissena polymorpha TaxID=45954 RepID=A0A9D4DG56_DREPO|nr:hypothetical protein DPMN_181914 [Dreissena polymorpha]